MQVKVVEIVPCVSFEERYFIEVTHCLCERRNVDVSFSCRHISSGQISAWKKKLKLTCPNSECGDA